MGGGGARGVRVDPLHASLERAEQKPPDTEKHYGSTLEGSPPFELSSKKLREQNETEKGGGVLKTKRKELTAPSKGENTEPNTATPTHRLHE